MYVCMYVCTHIYIYIHMFNTRTDHLIIAPFRVDTRGIVNSKILIFSSYSYVYHYMWSITYDMIQYDSRSWHMWQFYNIEILRLYILGEVLFPKLKLINYFI